MRVCKACGKEIPAPKLGMLPCVDIGVGYMCWMCHGTAVDKYIAEKEAARAKAPTLECLVEAVILDSRGSTRAIAEKIIAIVREHDNEKEDVNIVRLLKERDNWRERAEKDERRILDLEKALARASCTREKIRAVLEGDL